MEDDALPGRGRRVGGFDDEQGVTGLAPTRRRLTALFECDSDLLEQSPCRGYAGIPWVAGDRLALHAFLHPGRSAEPEQYAYPWTFGSLHARLEEDAAAV